MLQRLAHIVLDEAEMRMVEQRPDVAHRAGMQIVQANDGIAALQQRVANDAIR